MFIGLNPSTADENINDQTIRRCIGYAQRWGYAGLHMVNLFAFRATDPNEMKKAPDPIGPANNRILLETAVRAKIIIAAWGTYGTYLDRDKEIQKMIPKLHYLTLTKDGFPGHPCRLSKKLIPLPWR